MGLEFLNILQYLLYKLVSYAVSIHIITLLGYCLVKLTPLHLQLFMQVAQLNQAAV